MLLGGGASGRERGAPATKFCGARAPTRPPATAASPAMKQGGRCSDRQLGRGYGTAGMRCPSRKTKRPPAAGHQRWPVPRPCRAGGIPGKSRVPTATAPARRGPIRPRSPVPPRSDRGTPRRPTIRRFPTRRPRGKRSATSESSAAERWVAACLPAPESPFHETIKPRLPAAPVAQRPPNQ